MARAPTLQSFKLDPQSYPHGLRADPVVLPFGIGTPPQNTATKSVGAPRLKWEPLGGTKTGRGERPESMPLLSPRADVGITTRKLVMGRGKHGLCLMAVLKEATADPVSGQGLDALNDASCPPHTVWKWNGWDG